MEGIIAILSVFGTIFGIFYLFLSTRNKERLALIEKGVDASIFFKGKRSPSLIGKIIVLNFALVSIGIGLGIFIGSLIHYNLGVDEEVAYPGTIFMLAGLGLLIGVMLANRLEKKEREENN